MKRFLMFISLIVLTFVITACGTDDNKNEKDAASNSENQTITIEHELGKTDVSVNPKKVVVFDYGILDTLDKIGVDVVGVPQATVPNYLEKYKSDDYENVGSLKEPDFEKIAEIDPDLIIISGRQSDVYDELSKLGPTIYLGVDATRYMDSFHENMDVVAKIFSKEDEMDKEVKSIDDAIAALHEKAANSDQEALIVLANDDKISAYGSNSRFGLIHDVFGVKPVDNKIEASTHGMNVSFEYVVEHDPDLLYVIDRGAAIGEKSSAKQVVENKLVKKTKAYQNDNITYLNPEYWYLSGGGLQSIKEMVDEIDGSIK
ncbi:siderophore ABC transporter substrate-binding protein [Virgibacillus soli]|uniref:siderophore ABC transporter substrate-binding protein n=1 Tax=Paracerasibacillus soli TaxID=480284 RepID=UPI0035E9C482